jgi:hypothetical protein
LVEGKIATHKGECLRLFRDARLFNLFLGNVLRVR